MNGRYKVVASKFNYYLGVVIAVGAVIFFVLLFEIVVLKNLNDNVVLIAYLVTSPYSLYLLYVNVSKNIHGQIDSNNGTFIYGNIFFQQEIGLNEVKILKRKFLSRNTYVVEIGKKRFILTARREDLKAFSVMM